MKISLVFITQPYFFVRKEVILNSKHLLLKIRTKRELQNIAINHSADIDYENVMKIYRKFTSESHSFLTIDSTLAADNLLRFRKNLLDSL